LEGVTVNAQELGWVIIWVAFPGLIVKVQFLVEPVEFGSTDTIIVELPVPLITFKPIQEQLGKTLHEQGE